MRRVSSTEIQNNFGNYLLVAQEQDLIITRNGKDVAKLSGVNPRRDLVSEEALAQGYGLRKATYEEFLELTKEETLERYEYIDGEIFLQASPKVDHQYALSELHVVFHHFLSKKPCEVFMAPFDIRISRRTGDINVVQPDLLVICDLKENLGTDGYYHGVPDLVVEILAEGTKRNDLLKKLNLYLEGGVKEYWMVDPKSKQVTIYHFVDGDIGEHITFSSPHKATSFLFPELTIDLSTIFF